MNLLPPILLVDDNADDRDLAALVLAGAFGEVTLEAVPDAGVLTRALNSRRFGLVITEFELSWIDGAEVVRLARELRPDCAIVMFTSNLTAEVVEEAIQLGVDAFVPKSSDGFTRLPVAVRSALYRARRRALDTAKDAPYRRIFEGLSSGVFVAASTGEIVEANVALAGILGFDRPEEVTRRSIDSLFLDRGAAEEWRAGLESRETLEHIEIDLKRVDDSSVRVRISAKWVEGEVVGTRQLLGRVDEIGPVPVGSEELVRQSAELERSNEELEQMVYVVSHDLQQPLNAVGRFLDLLLERDADNLSESGRDYLEHAISGAGNLQRMVDAVLRYSRIDTKDQELEPVDLNRVRDKVLSLIDDGATAVGAEITSDDLPAVMADEAQMEQLFQNLLSNALKFNDDSSPTIRISAVEQSNEWVLAFSDNGIGIDPRSTKRVFQMFQRLHTEEEYPGTGIGLAVCKRIVVRHGGRIWVESQPGQGATFFVALPKRTSPLGRGGA
jgi:signal transduction histidine kinase